MFTIDHDDCRQISLSLNGSPRIGWTTSRLLLTDFLRHTLGASGTHVGCEHGVCGACTILFNGRATRACLTLAVQADGQSITTVEGLENDDGSLATLQTAFAEHFSLQCGFCTPGILISATEFLSKNPRPSREDVTDLLSGHICRCTGYYPIVDAIMDAAQVDAAEADRPISRRSDAAEDR